jgi:hypothetical protein
MNFSNKQVRLLQRSLAAQHIRTRTAHGRDLNYIEGWHAIAEANRIFGFDGWDRETTEARCVVARERAGTFLAVYVAKVRITVRVSGTAIVREGNGTGEARGGSPGEVHDMALKTAETDATKRALATFGRPFGLALYLSPKPNPWRGNAKTPKVVEAASPSEKHTRALSAPAANDTVSVHQAQGGDEQQPRCDTDESCQKNVSGNNSSSPQHPGARESAVRTAAALANGVGHIDKSRLALGEPKRLRDKAHLLFVASQPCLICGRQPSDPHHLRFTQPRAMGRKVSDEFTVPLCRIHHRAVHHTGHEAAWWEDLGIDAVEIARGLWQESHDQQRSMHQTLTTALDQN